MLDREYLNVLRIVFGCGFNNSFEPEIVLFSTAERTYGANALSVRLYFLIK